MDYLLPYQWDFWPPGEGVAWVSLIPSPLCIIDKELRWAETIWDLLAVFIVENGAPEEFSPLCEREGSLEWVSLETVANVLESVAPGIRLSYGQPWNIQGRGCKSQSRSQTQWSDQTLQGQGFLLRSTILKNPTTVGLLIDCF